MEALLAAADRGRAGEAYNVGSGTPVSVNELVRELGSPATVALPKRPGEPDCTWADIGKVTRDLDWRPRIRFDEGVGRMMAEIDNWRDAPLWDPESIARATRVWFNYLGAGPAA